MSQSSQVGHSESPVITNALRALEVEAVRQAMWHALGRPPTMVEVARFRDGLRTRGFAVEVQKDGADA